MSQAEQDPELRLENAFHELVQKRGLAIALQAIGRLMVTAGKNEQDTVSVGGKDGRLSIKLPASHAADSESSPTSPSKTRNMWGKAVEKLALGVPDPWANRGIHRLPAELCTRHRFNPAIQDWVTDEVMVKMEERPFAAGAMRECYAMKKASTFSAFHNWKHAGNFVAKFYKKERSRQVYYDDVMLQMDAKALGEAYNLTEPPKKVDMLQCFLVQFKERASSPLCCVENLIEGEYVKYNSNSGFVNADDQILRSTPQAFSHFTFEHTQGRQLCVDIQGVGDIYTDPQIHTFDSEGYGSGNLGLRGMAFFFRSHECNALCHRLGLQPFTRCEVDVKSQGYESSRSKSRSGSDSWTLNRLSSNLLKQTEIVRSAYVRGVSPVVEPRTLLVSLRGPLPLQADRRAYVHLEVARIYAEAVALPELSPEQDPEDARFAAMFHIRHAARKGVPLAQLMLARMYSGLEPSGNAFAALFRASIQNEEMQPHPEIAFRYLALAAERGVRGAAAALAHSLQSGTGVAAAWQGPQAAAQDLLLRIAIQGSARPVQIYNQQATEEEARAWEGACKASYELMSDRAQLLMRGGDGLQPRPRLAHQLLQDAAAAAQAAMKARLASQLYMLAEEAAAMVDGDDDGDDAAVEAAEAQESVAELLFDTLAARSSHGTSQLLAMESCGDDKAEVTVDVGKVQRDSSDDADFMDAAMNAHRETTDSLPDFMAAAMAAHRETADSLPDFMAAAIGAQRDTTDSVPDFFAAAMAANRETSESVPDFIAAAENARRDTTESLPDNTDERSRQRETTDSVPDCIAAPGRGGGLKAPAVALRGTRLPSVPELCGTAMVQEDEPAPSLQQAWSLLGDEVKVDAETGEQVGGREELQAEAEIGAGLASRAVTNSLDIAPRPRQLQLEEGLCMSGDCGSPSPLGLVADSDSVGRRTDSESMLCDVGRNMLEPLQGVLAENGQLPPASMQAHLRHSSNSGCSLPNDSDPVRHWVSQMSSGERDDAGGE